MISCARGGIQYDFPCLTSAESLMRNDDRVLSLMTANLVHPVRVHRVTGDEVANASDVAATEEPMEVRLHGEPFAVIMRTPGADRELAAGFLVAERVIHGIADLEGLARDPERPNVIDVRLRAPAARRLAALLEDRRRVLTTSACGLCGRVTIESVMEAAPPVRGDWHVPADLVPRLPVALRSAQTVFDETGGLHAAGLFDRAGALTEVAEDIGRHNAVDKVVGRLLLADRLPLDERILFVSGRLSFEIVQKALLAGIPVVGGVSAPSSLAVELAEQSGITLLGFVRGGAFNIYTHPRRIAHAS